MSIISSYYYVEFVMVDNYYKFGVCYLYLVITIESLLINRNYL